MHGLVRISQTPLFNILPKKVIKKNYEAEWMLLTNIKKVDKTYM